MKVVKEIRYAIPAMGICDLCLKDGQNLNRVYHHYDGTCDCHSPNHFDLWDVCDNCEVPSKLGQEFEIEGRILSLKELKLKTKNGHDSINQN